MTDFYLRTCIYLLCFFMSFYALNALDFNRFIKKGRVAQAQLLYFLIACCLGYLSGSFLISLIWHFSK